jgi:hypothetical protein
MVLSEETVRPGWKAIQSDVVELKGKLGRRHADSTEAFEEEKPGMIPWADWLPVFFGPAGGGLNHRHNAGSHRLGQVGLGGEPQ